MEPTVLPARFPNLLVNGSSGIAVGIATKIPPHNMAEVFAGLKALIRDPDISSEALMQYIPAPDFPTGGEIIMGDGVKSAYVEGKGGVVLRAKMHIEELNNTKKKTMTGKSVIAITELPYQTNKVTIVCQVEQRY
jgi:DNA gyrase subunit A